MGYPTVKELESYIRKAAKVRGLDPDIAVKVAKKEGLQEGTWQSNFMQPYGRERSYGPLQLHVAPEGRPQGLGNVFIKQTGLDPSNKANVLRTIDFGLDVVQKKGWGQWYGAKHVPGALSSSARRPVEKNNNLLMRSSSAAPPEVTEPSSNTLLPSAPSTNLSPTQATSPGTPAAGGRSPFSFIHNMFPNGLTGLRGIISDPNWQPSGLTQALFSATGQGEQKTGLDGQEIGQQIIPASYEQGLEEEVVKSLSPSQELTGISSIGDVNVETIKPKVPSVPKGPSVSPEAREPESPTQGEEVRDDRQPVEMKAPVNGSVHYKDVLPPVPGEESLVQGSTHYKDVLPEKESSSLPVKGLQVADASEDIFNDVLTDEGTMSDAEPPGFLDGIIEEDERPGREAAAQKDSAIAQMTPEEKAFYDSSDPEDRSAISYAAKNAIRQGFGPGVLAGEGMAFSSEAAKQAYFNDNYKVMPGWVNTLDDMTGGLSRAGAMRAVAATDYISGNVNSYSDAVTRRVDSMEREKQAYAEENPGKSLVSAIGGSIPISVAAAATGTGALALGANALTKAFPAIGPTISAASTFLKAAPETGNLLTRIAGRTAAGAGEGALSGASTSALTESDLGTDMMIGAGISSIGRNIFDPIMHAITRPLRTQASYGVSDLIKRVEGQIDPAALPRGDQIVQDPAVLKAGTQLMNHEDLIQAQAVSKELARLVGAPKPYITREILKETEESIGTALDDQVSQLGIVPHTAFFQGLSDAKQYAIGKLGATAAAPYMTKIDELSQMLASGPMTGTMVRGITDTNSIIGGWLKSANGNDREIGKKIYEVLDRGLLDFATTNGTPEIHAALKQTLQRYRNTKILFNSIGDNSSGTVNPRMLRAAVAENYGPEATYDPNNLLPTLARLTENYPEVTTAGTIVPHGSTRTDQPFRSITGGAAPTPAPGNLTSANTLLSQSAPLYLSGLLGSAAAGNALLGGGLPGTIGLIAAGGGAMAYDQMKKAGWRKLFANPEYRKWVTGQRASPPKLPAQLNILQSGGKVIPPAAVGVGTYERRYGD